MSEKSGVRQRLFRLLQVRALRGERSEVSFPSKQSVIERYETLAQVHDERLERERWLRQFDELQLEVIVKPAGYQVRLRAFEAGEIAVGIDESWEAQWLEGVFWRAAQVLEDRVTLGETVSA